VLAVELFIWDVMLLNTLHDSDNPEDQNDVDHNPAVAYLLDQTYAHMSDLFSALEAYDTAYGLAQACLSLAMSKRQRMRVHYAVASACLRLGQYSEALDALNSAIEQAAELPDPGAYAELAYLAAEASSRLVSFHAAAEYARISLGILRFLARDRLSVDASLEVRVLVALASSEFLLARYTGRHASLGRHLSGRILTLSLAWSDPAGAPPCADGQSDLRPIHSFVGVGSRQLSTIISSIALDFADDFSARCSSSGHATYVKLARPYVLEAQCHAHEANDAAAMRSASLIQARFDSIAGHDVNRVRVIEGVIGRAEHDDDQSMLAQGYTTLGRDTA
jgi:tetratricopeptide (TPR) repeat protein